MTSLNLQSLKPQTGARRRKLRKGRGIAAGQGASCGFGMRGQKSRSGRPTRPGFEGGQMPLYRRVPKLKHFTLINPKNFTVINVAKLADLKAGSTVNIDSLVKDGIVTSPKHPLKVLGNGDLKVKLTEAAGGSCEVI
jgi:large subunit ribosomal protein L15